MVFDKEEQKDVNSWVKELKKIRKEVEHINFSDVADYCVARREETIKLFLEMAKFIEDNIDVFYNPDWKWVASNKCYDALKNLYNPVLGYSKSNKEYIHFWIPGGLKFLYHLTSKRVLWITHEHGLPTSSRDTSPDMEKWKYNFFDFWKNGGQYPIEGYEQYVKTPAYESYFGKKPDFPQAYFHLKKKVDEDWENAKICRACLKEAIVTIHSCDRDLLKEINSMKADIRIAREDEGF